MPLSVRVDGAEQMIGLEALLRPFAIDRPAGDDEFSLRIRYGNPSDLEAPRHWLPRRWAGTLANGAKVSYWGRRDRRRIDLPGRASLRADLTRRHGRLTIRRGSEADAEFVCVLPLLCEFLARTGQHFLHGAAMAVDTTAGRRAMLLAGSSGRGKTTAALALAAGGMTLLADDVCFVGCEASGAATVWGLPRYCNVHDDTIALLGWPADLPSTPSPEPTQRRIAIRNLPNAADGPGEKLAPAALLILGPRRRGDHRLTPVGNVKALTELTRENVRAYDDRSDGPAAHAFAAMAAVVRQCDTYVLNVGTDLTTLPATVGDLPALHL